jgi:hypothetical protein
VIFAMSIRTTIAVHAKPMAVARGTSLAGNGPEHLG